MLLQKSKKLKLNSNVCIGINMIILACFVLFPTNAGAFIAADRTVKIMEDTGAASSDKADSIKIDNLNSNLKDETDDKISYKIKDGKITKDETERKETSNADNKESNIFFKGYKNYKEKNFDEAIKYFKMAIAENPQNFLAYFYLSNIYLEKRMYNEANEIIEASNRIKMSTADRDALTREGMVEITEPDSLKYKEAALADYKKALRMAGNGNWLLAIQSLKNAITLDPANELYYVKLGELYSDSQNIDKALDCFDKTLAINPDNQKALKHLAKFYSSKKQDDKANEYYSRLYQLTGDKSYLKKINQNNKSNAITAQNESSFSVIKRRGNTVFVNSGYENGLKIGDQIKKHLLVYKAKANSELRDPRTSKIIGYEKPILVGELMVTQIENKYCESIITSEINGGINVGDDVKWKE